MKVVVHWTAVLVISNKSVGMLVGVTLLCTLGTDGCTSMERVILLLSSV
jgi:hypothetical protein